MSLVSRPVWPAATYLTWGPNLGCPRRRNRRIVSAKSAPSAERRRSGSSDVVHKNDVAHRIPSCSSAISLEMSANRFLGMATSATHNATTVAHHVRVNFDQLVLQGCATSCGAIGSPEPAGRLWHLPHSTRTLRSAGVRASSAARNFETYRRDRCR